jgi:diguanylate cyclase (GGDEF)-like protein
MGPPRAFGYARRVPPRARILVVDDSPTQLDAIVQVLAREGYDVRTAADGKEAIRKVHGDGPDLVLLDLILPDMDGLEVLRIVKAPRPDGEFTPVIILSSKTDLDSKVRGLRIGADDYLAKPPADREILARVEAMLRIKRLQDELRGTKRELEDKQRQLEEKQRQLEQQSVLLAEQSITDPLTALKNRRFFDERLVEEFRRAQRYSDPVSLMMIDLDHFKLVNDRHGHQAGDLVLREAGALIRGSIREPDICARYGGEEFAVILPKTHMSGALVVAERVWKELGQKVYRHAPPGGRAVDVQVTASIGIAFYPSKDIGTPELLLKFADEALYNAKRAGRNTICLYQAQPYRYDASAR